MLATISGEKREAIVIGLIGIVHAVSHVYMLVLPPLFPLLNRDLGLGFSELGFIVAAYAVATAATQTPAGFLCERFGPRLVLIVGLTINAGAIMATAFTNTYWELFTLMVIAGCGSSVFHPADYQILTNSVAKARLGRAFAVHGFGGQSGFTIAPLTIVGLTALFGWKMALFWSGFAGLALATILLLAWPLFGSSVQQQASEAGDQEPAVSSWRLLMSPLALTFFLFYAFVAASNVGITHFGAVVMTMMHNMDLTSANMVVTAFLMASAIMVLPGGWIADKSKNPNRTLLLGFIGSAMFMVPVAYAGVPVWLVMVLLLMAGALKGLVIASRDLMVRQSVPSKNVGTMFAFVTTGVLVGQTVSPLIYGYMLDFGLPGTVLIAAAGASVVCAFLALLAERVSARRKPA